MSKAQPSEKADQAEKAKQRFEQRKDRLWLILEAAMWKAPANVDTFMVRQLLTPFIEALAKGKPPKKPRKAAKAVQPTTGFHWPNTTDKYRAPEVWGWPQAHASDKDEVFTTTPGPWLMAHFFESAENDDLYVLQTGLDMLEGKGKGARLVSAGLRDIGEHQHQQGGVKILCCLLRASKWRLATLCIYQMLSHRESALATSNANFDRGRAYWIDEFARFRATASDLTDDQAKAVVVNLLRNTADRIGTFYFKCRVPQRGVIVPLIPLRPVMLGAASRDPVLQEFCKEVWPRNHQPHLEREWEMQLQRAFDPSFAHVEIKLAQQVPDSFAGAYAFGRKLREKLNTSGGLMAVNKGEHDLHLSREENPARERVEGSPDLIGQKVTVYRNLHLDTFSVRLGTKVVLHSDWVKLRNAKFVVQPGGRDTVRRTKAKLVHAYISGILEDYADEGEAPAAPSLPHPVGYNPYKDDTFMARDTDEPAFTAAEVELLGTRAYASGLNGGRESNPRAGYGGYLLAAAIAAGAYALFKKSRVS